MKYRYAIYEKKGRIAYVTINRPERMNALHIPAMEELRDIWADFRDDPEVWVGVLTGAGDRAFCTGDDVKDMAEKAAQGIPVPEPFPLGGFGGITNRFECWKPIIAAVHGYCLAGGWGLALACDIIVAADNTRFGLPETLIGHLATNPVHRLPRQVPYKWAMGLILTGRQISAEEAYRVGMVNEVVPRAELTAAAERWAEEILQGAPLAVRASKEAASKGIQLPLDIALNTTFWTQREMLQSADATEGPTAFAEKRKPVWKGK
ncbi:MAG: enoyl-CoA hydratase/isomerase family protein [Chloroflexi bacterium]|nr:enoyl-CoA hydratase/isomerase family protein [Chloroflexota bacterium]